MRRIDAIRGSSVGEIASMLIKSGMDKHIDFCQSTKECSDYEEEHGEIPQAMCKECLVKWLMEDV